MSSIRREIVQVEVFARSEDERICAFQLNVEGQAFLIRHELIRASDDPYLLYPLNEAAEKELMKLGVGLDRRKFEYFVTSSPYGFSD